MNKELREIRKFIDKHYCSLKMLVPEKIMFHIEHNYFGKHKPACPRRTGNDLNYLKKILKID